MRLAGTRFFPLYGVLEHRGRRSGKVFRTPVVVRPTSDGFVVPMPWGEGTDWCRNVRASGQAVIRWNGRAYLVDRPEVLDAEAAGASFSPSQQAGMRRFGIRQVLHLHRRAD
jgi:deazaflavin-dependent oxidoreductase (nitroreductase family)